jgi:fructokinase
MKTPGLIEALRRATVRRLGGYVRASQLDSGFERFVTGPGLGDDSGITGAILLGKRAASGA